MKGVIKGVLYEELQNSLRMKREYDSALANLPKGSLSVKKIRGHHYCYVAKRVGDKVKFIYKGKIPDDEKMKYEEVKQKRAKYRNLLSQVKKQIKFLRSSLRGKEAI